MGKHTYTHILYHKSFQGYRVNKRKYVSTEEIIKIWMTDYGIRCFSSLTTKPKTVSKSESKMISKSCVNDNSELELINMGEVQDLIELIEKFLQEVESVKIKGYINSFDLTNELKYPTLRKSMISLIDFDSHKFKNIEDLIKYLANHNVRELIDLVRFSYDLTLLKLHQEVTKVLTNKQVGVGNSDSIKDLEVLNKLIQSKMDPSIRVSLQKRGLVITQNIYTGFDTEYKNVSLEYNKLLSVQMAVNTKTIIKIPKRTPYLVGKINTITGVFNKGAPYKFLNRDKIECSIENVIKNVRSIKYEGYDLLMDFIIGRLKDLQYPSTNLEGFIQFNLPRTTIHQWIKVVDEFTFLKLVRTSNKIVESDLEDSLVRFSNVFNEFKDFNKRTDQTTLNRQIEVDNFYNDNNDDNNKNKNSKNYSDELDNVKNTLVNIDLTESNLELCDGDGNIAKHKKYTRTFDRSMVSTGLSISRVKNNFFIAHLTAADLSMLKDFNNYKDQLDVINNCIVTLKKPILIDGVNVFIRDTMLLAPGSSKSLASIGNLYGETFQKIAINPSWYAKMDEFMIKDFKSFKEYALRDALIALIHGSYMEEFNNCLGRNTIPLSLASLSTSFIKKHWKETGYDGYQIHPDHLLSNPNQLQTPKGLHHTGGTGLHMSWYLANYKAGRNECFMYGYDDSTKWFDYDLTSAYTSVMTLLGDPDYSSGINLDSKKVIEMSDTALIESYTVISCAFKFKSSVKYPSIPCFVGKDVIVYPLNGRATITGLEYLVAMNQGCEFEIFYGYSIPFKKVVKGEKVKETVKPFKGIIDEVQRLRNLYPKKSINNLLYKEIGNSGYGLITKGISDKKLYDNRIKEVRRVDGNDISNPIIASWITGFVRSLIGETLHNTHSLGGRIVSVTTDGFITDLDNLEDRIKSNHTLSTILLELFSKTRQALSGNSNSFELKTASKGVLSWTTRGQLGLESGTIVAATGFQRKGLDYDCLRTTLVNTFKSEDKLLSFIQHSLRSGSNILKKGGVVTPVYTDKLFRMGYDNRREIVNPNHDSPNNVLLDSKPLQSGDYSLLLRHLMRFSHSNQYQKNTSGSLNKASYKDYTEIAVRKFIRSLMVNDYNLKEDSFNNYNEIVSFIKDFKPDHRINVNNVSNLKRRPLNKQKIVKNTETVKFAQFVKDKFEDFDMVGFLDK